MSRGRGRKGGAPGLRNFYKAAAKHGGEPVPKGTSWTVHYAQSISANSYAPEGQVQPDPRHGEETRRRVEAMEAQRAERLAEERRRKEAEAWNAVRAARARARFHAAVVCGLALVCLVWVVSAGYGVYKVFQLLCE